MRKNLNLVSIDMIFRKAIHYSTLFEEGIGHDNQHVGVVHLQLKSYSCNSYQLI